MRKRCWRWHGITKSWRQSFKTFTKRKKRGSDVFRIPTGTTTANFVGNVGIGTTSPSQILHTYIASGSIRTLTETGSSSSSAFTAKNTTQATDYGTDSNGGFIQTQGAYPLIIYTNSTERMRIFASGNVRFSSQVYGNTVASPRTLYIASDGELGGISSIRASKTNINQLDSKWLMELNPVSFNYRKKDDDGDYTDEHYDELFYGLIAEETELVNKEICTYNDGKLVGIEYSKLVPVLVKAIQEQNQQIQELKQLINK